MDKIINSRCLCKGALSSSEEVLILVPCEHFLHLSCIKNIINRRCPYCKQRVENILMSSEIKLLTKEKKLYYSQLYIDLLTVSSISDLTSCNMMDFIFKIPTLTYYLYKLMTVNSLEQVYDINNQLIAYCNINIDVVGLNKLYNGPKVIISNHSCPFDPIVLLNVFKCGFLGSRVIKDIWYLQGILPYLPILIIKRGKTKDTVKKMTKYIGKKNDLCVFPEGMTTHPKTLAKFRSGSFHTGYPVQPVVIQYDPCVVDSSYTKLLVKGTTQEAIKVTVRILDPVFPPFNSKKIEGIREQMAKSCNLLLSRVSGKDIVDS